MGRCEKCRFWEQIDESDDGFCKRYPPTVVVFIEKGESAFRFRQPSTIKVDFCGEFKDSIEE